MSGPAAALVAVVLFLHAGVLGVVAVNLWSFRRNRPRGGAEGPVRVSVLVPARNEEANLQTLLPSLLAQRGIVFEVVVVDDASEDGTWAVLERSADPRLVAVRSAGPPVGWVGKTHALHTAAARASGSVFVFLDADAALRDPDALGRVVGRWQRQGGPGTALTGMPHYLDRGPAALLTGLVPFAVVAGLPVPLVHRTANPALSALNGQVWAVGADDYRRLAPHEAHAAEVLEDVMIGRFLKRSGIRLHLVDLQGEVAVRMYGSFGEAWRGFRKNAYLLGGGRPGRFAAFFALYTLVWVAPSVLWALGPAGLAPLATLVVAKGLIDRWQGLPLWTTLCAPLVLALGAALQLDSALAHARGRVAWKGREVGGGP
ncbi:MAG TPA: glycosyltransferase [Rubricoccaceae bacterium]